MSYQVQPYLNIAHLNGSIVLAYQSNDKPQVIDLRLLNLNVLPDSTLVPRGLDYSYHCRIIKDCITTIVHDHDEEALKSLLDYKRVNNFFLKFAWQRWVVSITRRHTVVLIQHMSISGAWFNIEYNIDEEGKWHGTASFSRLDDMMAGSFDWRQFFGEQAWRRGMLVEVRYEVDGFLVYGGECPDIGLRDSNRDLPRKGMEI